MILFWKNHASSTPLSRTLFAFALSALVTLQALAAPQSIGTADPSRYLDDIKSLTAPSMEGRGDDTKGLARAAHLLEKRYHELGLKPAGTNSYSSPSPSSRELNYQPTTS